MTDIQQIISDLEQQKAAIEAVLASLRGFATGAPERRGRGRPSGTRGPGRPSKKHPGISEEGRYLTLTLLRKSGQLVHLNIRWPAPARRFNMTDLIPGGLAGGGDSGPRNR